MAKLTMNQAEKYIRKQDPRFLDWSYVVRLEGMNESLIREYIDFIWDRIAWLIIGIQVPISEEFKREFEDKFVGIFGD